MKQFDVIVIGGGHAGSEAAAAAARMGATTALVTLRRDGIGVMSCNPAIGGLGKGHLVREIDAMDGVMGRIADKAGIQFRLLNRRKGPAVQGPRAQADRKIYRTSMLAELSETPNLQIVEGEVSRLVLDRNAVSGVLLAGGEQLSARSVILTAGTFLNGLIHIGDVSRPGGRVGDKPSVDLAAQLADLGLARGRLKTGTPPRLNGKTIRWDVLEQQPGDDEPVLFSFLNARPEARQISCGITHTNEKTHDIIRANLKRSAMYGGHIEGVGPRYCPSIEDKVVRFADKTGHQVFLEPEGLDDDTVYPNGISTSLPADVQEEYVRSIFGLEQVEILQPGYAIEYDYFDPRELSPALHLRKLPGLFLAGQINGTTGYEEAAAQGLVAGLNAARHARAAEPVLFERTESYIGVMIDDLVTRGVTEPYRMFTSRAEYRLVLRADNADQRLTPLGQSIGCVSGRRSVAFQEKMEQLGLARDVLENATFSPQELGQRGVSVSQDGVRRSVLAVLSYPDVTQAHAVELAPAFADFPAEIRNQVECDARYAPYLKRQEEDAEALRRDASVEIPVGFDFMALSGLSSELKGKLHRVQPRNLAHASRIEGMTPAALTLILALVRKAGKAVALP